MDCDQIRELIRRTPGIEPEGRIMAYHFIADDMHDADIAVQEGGNYSRSTVTRRLPKVISLVQYRYEKDKELKAGA